MIHLDPFTAAYVRAALWSSSVDDPDYPPGQDNPGGEPMDSHYGLQDIPDETLAEMAAHCKLFQRKARRMGIDFEKSIATHVQCTAEEYAGHDFWLTRNGHGCGFWDGDWHEPAATKLDELAKWFGMCDLYIGDDKLVYAM